MSGDTLSDLLRAVRLCGAVFFYVEGIDPWVAETPCSSEIVSAILPGSDRMMEFHGVASGSCWITPEGQAPVKLEEGDLVMLPQGDAHIMSSAPGLRAKDPDPGIFFTPRPSRLPHALSLVNNNETTVRVDGGGCESATLVCGFLGFDARPFNPLLSSLPSLIHIKGAAGTGGWISTFLRSAVDETNKKRPGGAAVLERMSEMMFIDAVRRYIEALPETSRGWLAGLRDRFVGRVLALMHDAPAVAWTVDELGRRVGLSRSALHERFAELIGQSPIQYLANWRIQVGAALLRNTSSTVAMVAQEVGYESEATFTKAFKRLTGNSPALWRRRIGSGAPVGNSRKIK